MKKKVEVVVVLLVLGVLGYLMLDADSEKRPSAKENKTSKAVRESAVLENIEIPGTPKSGGGTNLSTLDSPFSTNLASRAGAVVPVTNAIPALPPLTVLDNARVAIHNYNEALGENPVGTNPEITAALLGTNPKQVNFVTAESGLRVNDKGEMLDAWGTPFFFHQVSSKEMEIRSAGEDKKMWTFDDQVTR